MISIKIKHEESMTLIISKKQWIEWRQGKHIQDAMPQLSKDEREFFISGLIGKEFDSLFGEDDA